MIIGLIVAIFLVYVSHVANPGFWGSVEAAPIEALTPTPTPTVGVSQPGSDAVLDLRLAPGCLLPSWTGLCRKATTPTPKASPTVTPAPTKTQTANLTPTDTQAGVQSQEMAKQPEVVGADGPTVQPKSGPEGALLLSLFGMLPFGALLRRK